MTKLEKRREQYEIPDVPYLPMGKRILVFRMPSEEKTVGGLFIPQEHAGPKDYGVIVAAGLKAREVLRDALIEIGDVVHFGEFEGREKEFAREESKKGKYLLQMNVEGLLGSVDAIRRAESYSIEENDEGDLMYVKRKAA